MTVTSSPNEDLTSGRPAQAGGGATGIDFSDPALEERIRRGLADVEGLLHEVLHSDFDFATRAARHLADAGGKRFRPLFTLLAAEFAAPGVGPTNSGRGEVGKAAAVVELVHLATLYHDDVMDEATIRRGATSANARWDNTLAILTGDFLFAQASALVADLGTEAARIMASTFEALVTGQMRESVGAGDTEDPIKHYLAVIADKTGSLIATSGRFGAMFAGAADEHVDILRRLGAGIGTAFQISDDIIDIASPSAESGKLPGTDLREGVRTLPMLYALNEDDGESRLRELLSGPLTSDELVSEALELLRASGGLERSRRTLDSYAHEAREELAALPECPAREALSSVVDYVVARTH